MSTLITICDDSKLARKQMARALPNGWDVDINFAKNGYEGQVAVEEGRAEVLFLDLNMPEMDGYQLLETIRKKHLKTMVIVVSGDIQPEARKRVIELGALDFIKKPVDKDQVREILNEYGFSIEDSVAANDASVLVGTEINVLECLQEVANVASGQAADLLARLLDVFVIMPIPNVNMLEMNELKMALTHVNGESNVSAVCQGFIGAGVAGEALLIFHDSKFSDIADFMRHEGNIDDSVELELLMDIASVLIGACLKGIADQLDIGFSQGHPIVLGHHVHVRDLLKRNNNQWKQALTIEMGYAFENRSINCDLLLLFTDDSMQSLSRLASFVLDNH